MKRVIIILVATFALFTDYIHVNAHPNCETFSVNQLENDNSFIELMTTNPETIYEKYNNVIDIQEVPLEEEINGCVEAYEYDETGLIEELDCNVKLNRIAYQSNSNTEYSVSANTSTLYILTAEASSKTSEDSLTEDGVTLKGCIGWNDVLGIGNSFEYASGSRSGSISGEGYYQALRGTHTLCYGNFATSFYSTSQDADTSGTQFRLIVRSGTTSGSTVQLNFTTSIFD